MEFKHILYIFLIDMVWCSLFIYINDSNQHDIIKLIIAWVVLESWANKADPEYMPQSATSDLGPHFLLMSNKRGCRII